MPYAVSSDYKSLVLLLNDKQPSSGYKIAKPNDIAIHAIVSDNPVDKKALALVVNPKIIKILENSDKASIKAVALADCLAFKKTPKALQDIILTDAVACLFFAKNVLKDRFHEGEIIIATDPLISYHYAKNVLKGRFEKGEDAIAQDVERAYHYARGILNDRFEAGEAEISKSAEYSFYYASDILKNRFPLGEKAISEDTDYAFYYAKDVLKERFPLGEAEIYKNKDYLKQYESMFCNSELSNELTPSFR